MGFLYSLKSTPRILVEVDGIGMEALRTACAAAAASPDFILALFLLGCDMPFDIDSVDMLQSYLKKKMYIFIDHRFTELR